MLYLPRSGKAALMSALRRPHIGGMKSVVFEGGEIIFPLTAQWASVKDTSCGNQGDVAALLCLSVCLSVCFHSFLLVGLPFSLCARLSVIPEG